MCLGALVDVGVPLEYLSEKLNQLGISDEFNLRAEEVHRNGQRSLKVHVDLSRPHSHSEKVLTFAHHSEAGHDHDHHEPSTHSHDKLRHLPEIEHIIQQATLPPRAEAWSLAVFRRLAEAEGAVHGISPEKVHFHEVGATDAIVDIVGTCLGFDWLGIDRLYCSALPTGGGTIRAAHGRLPVPVPAVLKLYELRQVPIYSNGIERELVTPTGAAIATTLATEFGAPPKMTLQKTGLGAGTINLPIPNMVRLWVGESNSQTSHTHSSSASSVTKSAANTQEINVLETQVDDLNPQAIGYLFTVLFEVGALDVFTQAIGMKKSRPGVLLTVICLPEKVSDCETVLFRETSTLGIRRSTQQRMVLDRTFDEVKTEYGIVRVKVASREGSIVNVQPEYEDCAQIAQQQNLPWREVHRMALQQWYSQTNS
jgi:pyridinium-3,5-bisthiocarboxylic acid mononucleotide nickel chelatase